MTTNGKTVAVSMKVNEDANDVVIYRSNSENFSGWTKVDTSINNGVAEFQVDEGGVFVARSHSSAGPIIGIVIGCIALGLIVIAAVVYFKKNPAKWMALRGSANYAEKSLSNKV